jgi:hypothetical protein
VALGRGDGAGVDPATGKNGMGIVRVPVDLLGLVGSSSVIVWHPAKRAVAERMPRRGFFISVRPLA